MIIAILCMYEMVMKELTLLCFTCFISVGNELNWMIAVSVVRISLASDRLSTSEASCSEVEVEVEMSKRGELLRRLALARAVLDIVLSVAVHVIIFKLLMSGDVEKNPGPGELDFNTVDASKPLGRLNNLYYIKFEPQCTILV